MEDMAGLHEALLITGTTQLVAAERKPILVLTSAADRILKMPVVTADWGLTLINDNNPASANFQFTIQDADGNVLDKFSPLVPQASCAICCVGGVIR
jgi:hypothetical protein